MGFLGVLVMLALCVLSAAVASGVVIVLMTYRERKQVRVDIAAGEAEDV